MTFNNAIDKISYASLDAINGPQYSDWTYTYFCSNNFGKLIYCFNRSGIKPESLAYETIKHYISDILKCKSFYLENSKSVRKGNKETEKHYYHNEDWSVYINLLCIADEFDDDRTETISISVHCIDERDYINIRQFFTEKFEQDAKETSCKNVYMFVNTGFGADLRPISTDFKYEFIRDNYEENVLKDYDYAFSEFEKKDPFGRLIVLNGSPGVGKTSMVKAFISSTNRCIPVILSPLMVPELDGPSLTQLLLDKKAIIQNKAILFIIEDADNVLIKREELNSHISSILNMTDGIFGSLLDIRFLTSTNAEYLTIDKAILRPGRLCKNISINALTPQKSESIYKRLSGGKEKEYKYAATLAEVYRDSLGVEVVKEQDKKNILGFGV